MSTQRYEEMCAAHRWNVPERYNIAADVCDKHPRDKPAMVWESFDGSVRSLDWGELQDLANQAAHTLAARGVTRGDRVAVVLPPTPETAAVFFGVWKLGAILLSMSVLYGDDGIEHRLSDSQAPAPRHRRRERAALRPAVGAGHARDRRGDAGRRADGLHLRGHGGGRSCAALLHVRHDRAREGHRARAPLHPRPRGVHVLPRGRGRRELPRHGRVGVGGGDRAAARPVAARRGAVRLPARGRVRPAPAALVPQPARRHERLHDADGDALDDGDRGRRHALPAGVPPRLLGRRAAQPGGDPLVPRAVRRHRARLLRPHRVVPARRELPVDGGAGGVDGQADAGLGRADPRRGRAAGRAGRARRDLPAGALEPALSARLLAQRRGRRRRRSAATGSTPRTPPSRTRTATTGTSAAPTT